MPKLNKRTILKYPWHIGHDYELSKIPANFEILLNTARRWNSNYRPMPSNFLPINSIEESKADLAILHVDQWTWQELDKRRLFLRLRNHLTIPKVVINHGCNLVDGCSSAEMADLIQDLPMICNSSTAQRVWQVENSRYIHHGMSIEEWPQSNYGNLNVVITQPPGGAHQIYRNNEAATLFEDRSGIKLAWIGRDYKFKNFAQYRAFLASASIYLHVSYASPNPRARTEAMLCGLAVVTTGAHGEAEYIDNGVNGFVSNDMNELYDYTRFLLANPREIERIGRAGREVAQKLFSSERFVAEWLEVIDDVLSGAPIARPSTAAAA